MPASVSLSTRSVVIVTSLLIGGFVHVHPVRASGNLRGGELFQTIFEDWALFHSCSASSGQIETLPSDVDTYGKTNDERY